MTTKAILFDADGVTIIGDRFSVQYARDFGVPTTTLDAFFRSEAFAQCLLGHGDLKEILAPYLETWQWKGTVDELLAYWFRAESGVDHALTAWVRSLRMRGVRCYLATNNEPYRTQHLRKLLADVFDGVFSSGEIGVKKHDPKYFEIVYATLAECGIQKSEVVLFDDLQANVDCAQQFGFAGHFYSSLEDAKAWLTARDGAASL